jgi:hypothetical protein
MDSDSFIKTVGQILDPVLGPRGFSPHYSASGRLYLAEFVSPDYVVSISFEPGDEFLQVAVFTVTNGIRSELDDRDATPRLSDLSTRFLHPSDATDLGRTKDEISRNDRSLLKLVKSAKELAIVLPRYFAAS